MKYSDCKNLTLEKDGIEVIIDVLNKDEIEYLQNKTWEWIAFKTSGLKTPVDRENKETYKYLLELGPKHHMIFQHWDCAHNPMSWYVRQNQKVIDKFTSIWKTSDLITSFDGISISLPCEITKKGWDDGKEWFHSDQSFKRNSFECVQGLVNIFDVNEGDATLRILKGSHNLHSEFQKHFNVNTSSDWYLLDKKDKKEKQFYIDRLGKDCDICIKAPAGSLVLWDSRTIHQGMKPQRGRKTENIRCSPYVCMTPKSLASQNELDKRIFYFKTQRTCNHWPHKIRVFGVEPYPMSVIPMVPKDVIKVTDLMKKLVGYTLENENIHKQPRYERFILLKRNDPEYPYYNIKAKHTSAQSSLKKQKTLYSEITILIDVLCHPNSKIMFVKIKEELKNKGVRIKFCKLSLSNSKITEEELIEKMKKFLSEINEYD